MPKDNKKNIKESLQPKTDDFSENPKSFDTAKHNDGEIQPPEKDKK